jgi:hypothetical protein
MSATDTGGTPSAPRSTDDAELLWNLMIKQQEFSVGQFATSLIGEGALLFAYAELGAIEPTYNFVRTGIAFLGFGAGVVLWIASFAARQDATATERLLKSKRRPLADAYGKVREWRAGSPWSWLYPSITRLIIYANAMIALFWLTLTIHLLFPDSFRTFGAGVVDIFGFFVGVLLWFILSDNPSFGWVKRDSS